MYTRDRVLELIDEIDWVKLRKTLEEDCKIYNKQIDILMQSKKAHEKIKEDYDKAVEQNLIKPFEVVDKLVKELYVER